FKWKPGDPKRGPAFVAPHQPRLDWQMWFAALGDYRANRWFLSFMVRLLQGSPEVLGLLEKNPFPAGPPRYLRAVLYQYHFTDFALRRADGDWWNDTDRKSTRLNSSHVAISYAVFCLKKKKTTGANCTHSLRRDQK